MAIITRPPEVKQPLVQPTQPTGGTIATTKPSSSMVVIGTSPTTGEVLVKDPATGDMKWVPGSESQIKEATSVIQSGSTYNKTYVPPGTTTAKTGTTTQVQPQQQPTGGITQVTGTRVEGSLVQRAPTTSEVTTRTAPEVTAEEAAYQKEVQAQNQALNKLKAYEKSPGSYDIAQYMLDLKESPAATIQTLKAAGFTQETIREAARGNLAEAEAARIEAQKPLYSKIWQGMTPWDESAGETATPAGVGIMAAEIIVPGVYTARHWDEMGAGEKALSLGLDVVTLLPFAGAAARGAKTITVAGRAARVGGAVKGVVREGVAMVRAPVDMIIHPVGTVKSGFKTTADFVENLAHPGKIPEAVLTTSEGSVRLKVTQATSSREAMQYADRLTELAGKGERPVVEIGGQTVELARSPFMKEAGGLVHATPDIEILEGARVKPKPGMPAKEQGWFVSHEPATQFTERAAFGKGEIPVPVGASGKVADIGKYRPSELVLLDKKPIRALNLADAKNIPDRIADPLLSYVRKNDGVIYGSMNEWVKVGKAAKPNDVDLVFRNAEKAIEDIEGIAKRAGYRTKRVPHGIEVLKEGEWVKLGDIASESQHQKMLDLPMITNRVDGVRVETLGKQYIGQAYGAVEKTEKAATRAKKLEKAAGDVKKIIKQAGITAKKPGILVIAPKSAAKTVASEKIFVAKGVGPVAEMERVLPVGERIPEIRQRLFTRIGPNKQRVEVWLEKPLSPAQRIKLKGIALVEDLKTPFNPAIKIKGAGPVSAFAETDVSEITSILARSGNVDQARAFARIAAAQRAAPRTIQAIVSGRRAPARTIDGEDLEALRKPNETVRETQRTAERRAAEERAPARREAARREAERPAARREAERERAERPPAERERPPRVPPERERPPRPPAERETPPRPPRPRAGRERPFPERPPRPPRPPKPIPPGLDVAGTQVQPTRFPKGTVAWKQGIGWWVFAPPYTRPEDRMFVLKKPKGAVITSDARSAAGTIQAVGGPSPVDLKFDMGVVDVDITRPPQKPSRPEGQKAISFKRDRDKSYSGVTATARSKKVGPYYYRNGAVSRKKMA